ncbi:GNAT family N-acetyltransferase [Sphingomonas sp. KR1UV-12]|uniref:GNAT family N-acetyltransferase n=1 Tax=Sphingomonas aurea TaxID=3063994 RepID=A0ABT9ENP2_9SPHN|nr:GNAT family N-acetyltransferase [Sphingomonas sp. KR1UV-12]MDP1028577.1 GNAT family N-acetyltransferase [Sphingomonas sp. KR1UV-12]
MTAPTLRTARLILSGHRPDDLDALTAIWSDPLVYAHIGGRARDREEVWLRLLRHIGQWTAFGHGMWVLREAETGQIVGEAGLMTSRRTVEPPLPDLPEAGWTLASYAHGRGLAREAMEAVLDWAGHAGVARTGCIIDPDNAASIRLAERLGYRAAGEARYGGRPILTFVRG